MSQIPLAFVPIQSNGRDVLMGALAPASLRRRRLIGEFLGPAGLGSGSGLAVVTATAPS
jgi:hypothetical protein